MKSTPAAACLMFVALGILPPALAAPKQAAHLRAQVAEAAGTVSAADVEYSFRAQSYTDLDGSRAGFVVVESFGSAAGYQFVTCTGPEFANVVSMNQGTGAVTVAATLDLANPNCYAVNYSSGSLALQVTGQPNGDERVSENGNGTQELGGSTFKYNFQSDTFSEIFFGSTGLHTGVFTGRATSSRSTNRTQTR